MDTIKPTFITATQIGIISSTKGFVQGKANETALFNRWFHRCKEARFPYISIVDKPRGKADLRFEIQTMDLPYPQPPCRLTDQAQGEILTLFAESGIKGGWYFVNRDAAEAIGLARERAVALSASILAIAFNSTVSLESIATVTLSQEGPQAPAL